MKTKGRVRPSKPASAMGLIVGVVFIGIGVFVAIPQAGAFGVFWTFIALAITGYHAFNIFSEDGVAHEVFDFETSNTENPPRSNHESPEKRIEKLETLKGKGLISSEEYDEQRKRILDEI